MPTPAQNFPTPFRQNAHLLALIEGTSHSDLNLHFYFPSIPHPLIHLMPQSHQVTITLPQIHPAFSAHRALAGPGSSSRNAHVIPSISSLGEPLIPQTSSQRQPLLKAFPDAPKQRSSLIAWPMCDYTDFHKQSLSRVRTACHPPTCLPCL